MTTQQEFFDKTVRLLIEQGGPAFEQNHATCKYRAKDGTKCAVGMWIPDEEYAKASFEGASVDTAAGYWPSIVTLADEVGMNLLHSMQAAHDGPAMNRLTGDDWVAAFKYRARRVADEFGLNTGVLQS